MSSPKINVHELAMEWQNFYNYKRPHSSLSGLTPAQKLKEVEHLIPIQPEVTQEFWDSNEQIYPKNSDYWQMIKKKIK